MTTKKERSLQEDLVNAIDRVLKRHAPVNARDLTEVLLWLAAEVATGAGCSVPGFLDLATRVVAHQNPAAFFAQVIAPALRPRDAKPDTSVN